jgi:hypothetical protein
MSGFSWLTRQRVRPVTHTHALFAEQSHSILDNLMELLGLSSSRSRQQLANRGRSIVIVHRVLDPRLARLELI